MSIKTMKIGSNNTMKRVKIKNIDRGGGYVSSDLGKLTAVIKG